MIAAVLAALALASAGPVEEPSTLPLTVQPVASAHPVRTDGGFKLLLEVELANHGRRDLQLEQLEVTDDHAREIALFAGADLNSMIVRPGADNSSVALRPGSISTAFLDIDLADGSVRPAFIHLNFRFKPSRPDAAGAHPGLRTMVLVDRRPPPVLAPLLDGEWLAANAVSNRSEHRRSLAVIDGRAYIAQRFATDFVRLDDQGHAFLGDPTKLENWAGYGSKVRSGAAGTVVEAVDEFPDNVPGAPSSEPISIRSIGGNHVVVKLSTGQFVFYGHLRAGSVSVRAGEKVAAGTPLGQVGNSGQSDAPHLHLHVADAASPLGADGLPFVFSQFVVLGHAASVEAATGAEGWTGGARTTSPTKLALPGENTVVRF